MNKYKLYKKHKRKNNTIIMLFIIVFLSIMSSSVGYSIWSTTLNIEGSTTLLKQDVVVIPPTNQPADVYVTSSLTSSYGTVENQSLIGNKLSLSVNISRTSGNPRTVYFYFVFKNNSDYTITNISSTHAYSGQTNVLSGDAFTSIPVSSLRPGGAVYSILGVPVKLNQLTTSLTTTTTINYLVNNEQKNFELEITFYR